MPRIRVYEAAPGRRFSGAVSPFFSDDFAGQQLNNSNGFVWGVPNGNSPPTVQSFDGFNAIRFRYGTTIQYNSEQPYEYGRPLSALWKEFDWYVPANESQATGPGAVNRKFGFDWDTNYGSESGTWQPGYEFEKNDVSDVGPSVIRPMSSWQTSSFVESSGLGHPDYHKPFIGNGGPVVRGAWNRIQQYMRAASASGATDGIMQMWVNGSLFASKTDGAFWNYLDLVGPRPPVLRQGYFMGSSNMIYAVETDFYIKRVRFYDINPGWT